MAKKKAAAKRAKPAPEKAAPQEEAAAAPEAPPRGTKAQAIRDALKAGRDKGPTEIAADLTAQGLNVRPQEVSTMKSQLKAKRRKKRAAAKAVAAAAEPTSAAAPDDLISLAALQAAKKLAAELGGVEKARQAINSLARLMD